MKVLKQVKKYIEKDVTTCLCLAIDKAEVDHFKISRSLRLVVGDGSWPEVLKMYGLSKYRPKTASNSNYGAWWPDNDPHGRRKRITVLNKRIKELSKNK